MTSKPRWNLEETIYLLRGIVLYGKKWDKIVNYFPKNHSADACKLKYFRIKKVPEVQQFLRKYQDLKIKPEFHDLYITANACKPSMSSDALKMDNSETDELQKMYDQDNSWTEYETAKLMEMYKQKEPKSMKDWTEIANKLQNKSWISCRFHVLQMNVQPKKNKSKWKASEEKTLRKILDIYKDKMKDWVQIANMLGTNRSPTAIKLKYVEMYKKKKIDRFDLN